MFKIDKTDSNLCTFCEVEEETIFHLIWQCPVVKQFLDGFVRHCHQKDIVLNLDGNTFIFGYMS